MTEGKKHKKLKRKVCGINNIKTEEALPDNQRLDCFNPSKKICGEVEFTKSRILYSIEKLKTAKKIGKCDELLLIVKDKHFDYASNLAKDTVIKVISESDESIKSKKEKNNT